MTIETLVASKLGIKFSEGHTYSYTVTTSDLINKIFNDPELDSLRTISKKLLFKVSGDVNTSKAFTIGAAIFDNNDACVNRIIREVEMHVSDTHAWSVLQKILTDTGTPQQIIEDLNSLKLIGKDTDPWDLLYYLNSKRKYKRIIT